MNFCEFLDKGRVYLDGGTGTELIKRGFVSATENLNVTNPDVLTEIHSSYVKAGSDVVYANTFNCNGKKADKTYPLSDLIKGAAKAARKARPKYVLYDCGPIGELMEPNGRLTFEDAYAIFAEQAKIAEEVGFDGAVIETMTDLKELRCALLAFKENSRLPIICSMSFDEGGRTFLGTEVRCFGLCAQSLGAVAVGINCGTGPDVMAENLKLLKEVVSVPVFAKPNAGMPIFKDGKTFYDMDKDTFACHLKAIAESGIEILGGCCGTDPSFIEAAVKATSGVPVRKNKAFFDGLCSFAKLVPFGERTVIIGEKINPTNRPLLKQALRDGDAGYVLSLCSEQSEQGADVLDYNVGLPRVEEKTLLPKMITATQDVHALPVCIDTSKPEALENSLRITDGVALINSVNGKKESMEKVFPLAVRYGAYVIALCLDENGIAPTAEERLQVAEKIAENAVKHGLDVGRILFDPLTMALSVNSDNGKILLEILDGLAKRGYKTVLGLSNISFGLPARNKLNGALYRIIKERKVTAVIVNPALEENSDPAAVALLQGKDDKCEGYISENAGVESVSLPERGFLTLKECVSRGLTKEALAKLEEVLTPDNADEIMNGEIIAGLNELGDRYAAGKVFLPGLIAGSETAKALLDRIKSVCFSEGAAVKATAVIATVKGDVHDIGKNIVRTVASNYGYRMIDLGRDVPCEKILQATEEYNADAVCLSALMTTTLDNMTETVKAVKAKFPDVKILVGGAVVGQEYADSVGAYYSKDAQEAAALLEKLFSVRA